MPTDGGERMDPVEDSALYGLRRLELELVVHDFISALNGRRSAALVEHMHPDIVYRPSHARCAQGRDSVLAVCSGVWAEFDRYDVEVEQLAVRHDIVLVEEGIHVGFENDRQQYLLGFASFRFSGLEIAEWRQIHA